MENKQYSVKLSEHLYILLEKKIKTLDFPSVDKFVEDVLLQIYDEKIEDGISKKEEEEIKRRLERLGYL